MDFYALTPPLKHEISTRLDTLSQVLGGQNFFLQLVEEIRQAKPNPLLAQRNVFHYSKGKINWNKSIYGGTLTQLILAVKREDIEGNALANLDAKAHKATLNMLKALKPIKFSINPNDGDSVSFGVFDGDRFSWEFKAIFFYPVVLLKKILAYKASMEAPLQG